MLGGAQTGREDRMTPEWIVEQVVKAESNDHKQSTDVWPYDGVRGKNVQRKHCHTLSHKREEKREREREREKASTCWTRWEEAHER